MTQQACDVPPDKVIVKGFEPKLNGLCRISTAGSRPNLM